MSVWTPNPKPIGWDYGAPPDLPIHHDDCEVHAYCECECVCHEVPNAVYIDPSYAD